MPHHVAMPFQVTGGPELDSRLAAVEAEIAAQDGVSATSVRRDAASGAVLVRFDVAGDDRKAVMRAAIRIVKAAVVSTGSAAAWRDWELDGPTRVTAG